MVRYFYYIVVLSMFLNIIINVPKILIEDRFNGSIMSLLVSIPIGTLLAYLFTKGISRFQKKGLPEILEEHMSAFIRKPYLVFLAIMWMASGSMALIAYTYIIKFYLNPEMSSIIIIGFLALVVTFGATRKTSSILYLTEIILVLVSPFILYIICKTVGSEYFRTVHIYRVLHYTWQMPTYSSISAATYVFIGYINLVIMNRYIDSKKALKYFWTIPFFAAGILITSFFIPIGFLGVHTVGDFIFPWMITADSLRMQYGFIERATFLLLFIYLQLVILFGIVTWHVGIELLKGAFISQRKQVHKLPLSSSALMTLILCIVSVLTIVLEESTNQIEFFEVVKIWLDFRFAAEIMLVLLIFLFSLRKRSV